MRFNSFVYFAFLALVVLVHWALPARARKGWLLLASYGFYASWHYPYLALLFGAGAVNHFGAQWLQKGDRKRRGIVLIAANLILLALFKYLDWLVSDVNGVLSLFGSAHALTLPGWVLPLGISFYLFHTMSYVLDIMRQRETVRSFWDFQLYIAFFPQLIAGPIMRTREFIPQLGKPWATSSPQIRSALWLIVSGLFVKIVIADALAPEVDQAFARSVSTLGAPDIALMAVAFGLQIYFDFSSYSRIAIGSSRLVGLELVENFNFPYSATNPADFWNRWHMSLSRWIRDYLFFPLVGQTPGKRPTLTALCRAAILSMALCGIWHGAGWTYVLWGVYHGCLVAAHHIVSARKVGKPVAAPPSLPKKLVLGLGTFALVSFGWLLFRARGLGHVAQLVKRLATPWRHHGRALSGTFYLQVSLLVLLVWAMPAVTRWAQGLADKAATSSRRELMFAALQGFVVGVMVILCLVYLRGQSSFIYFQF